MDRFTTPPLDVPPPEEGTLADFTRADLVFYGVDHTRTSYEARVFLNNPEASVDTARDLDSGYAGSFAVFGHGACYGDEGHCDPDQMERDPFDLRAPHSAKPLTKTVIITEALMSAEGEHIEVTVVAVDHRGEQAAVSDAMSFTDVRLLTYEG